MTPVIYCNDEQFRGFLGWKQDHSERLFDRLNELLNLAMMFGAFGRATEAEPAGPPGSFDRQADKQLYESVMRLDAAFCEVTSVLGATDSYLRLARERHGEIIDGYDSEKLIEKSDLSPCLEICGIFKCLYNDWGIHQARGGRLTRLKRYRRIYFPEHALHLIASRAIRLSQRPSAWITQLARGFPDSHTTTSEAPIGNKPDSQALHGGRVTLHDASCTIVIDGRKFAIKDDTLYLGMKALVEVGPRKITGREISKKVIGDERLQFSKVIEKLPKRLREYVISVPGRRGGYTFRLPLEERAD